MKAQPAFCARMSANIPDGTAMAPGTRFSRSSFVTSATSLPLKTTRYFALARLSSQDVSHGPELALASASSRSTAIVAAARVRLARKARRLGIGVGVKEGDSYTKYTEVCRWRP